VIKISIGNIGFLSNGSIGALWRAYSNELRNAQDISQFREAESYGRDSNNEIVGVMQRGLIDFAKLFQSRSYHRPTSARLEEHRWGVLRYGGQHHNLCSGKRIPAPCYGVSAASPPSRASSRPVDSARISRHVPRIIERRYVAELRKTEEAWRRYTRKAEAADTAADRALRDAYTLDCEVWTALQFIGGDEAPSPVIADSCHGGRQFGAILSLPLGRAAFFARSAFHAS